MGEISRVVALWRESLAKTNKKASEALADPTEYENLFPGLRENFQAEKLLKVERSSRTPALAFPSVTPNHERDVGAEAAAAAAGSDLDHVVGGLSNDGETTESSKENYLSLDEEEEMVTPPAGSPSKKCR